MRHLDHVLDRWVRSRLHSTVADVTDALEAFDALRAAQALESLVDDLSNWYVRRSRPRFWKVGRCRPRTRRSTSASRTVVLLLAPFCPFVTDELCDEPRTAPASRCTSPTGRHADAAAIDASLERDVEAARKVVTLGRAAAHRGEDQRAPAAAARARVAPERCRARSRAARRDRRRAQREARRADRRPRGPARAPGRAELPTARTPPRPADAAGEGDARRARRSARLGGPRARRRGAPRDRGRPVELAPDDVEIRAVAHEELALVEEGGYAVALDTTVDDDAAPRRRRARELVRAINDLRKALDLELSDRIRVVVGADGVVADAARRHGEWIAGEVLATAWDVQSRAAGEAPLEQDGAHALEVEGEAVAVALEVA